jgi:hypothetical protein
MTTHNPTTATVRSHAAAERAGFPSAEARVATRGGLTTRGLGLVASVVVLLAVAALSIAVGTKPIPLGTVWDALTGGATDPSAAADVQIIRDLRVPRTLIGLAAGMALGLAGALMQALTRNPLADPGILGINAGAAAAVVLAIRALGATSLTGYIWFAFAGASAAFVVGYLLGTRGRSGASPERLALAGVRRSFPEPVAQPAGQPRHRRLHHRVGVRRRPGDHRVRRRARRGGRQRRRRWCPDGPDRLRSGRRRRGERPAASSWSVSGSARCWWR